MIIRKKKAVAFAATAFKVLSVKFWFEGGERKSDEHFVHDETFGHDGFPTGKR